MWFLAPRLNALRCRKRVALGKPGSTGQGKGDALYIFRFVLGDVPSIFPFIPLKAWCMGQSSSTPRPASCAWPLREIWGTTVNIQITFRIDLMGDVSSGSQAPAWGPFSRKLPLPVPRYEKPILTTDYADDTDGAQGRAFSCAAATSPSS
jgi:hypothetical protein